MALFEGPTLIEIFPVSTSLNKPSCQADSFATPLGLHCLGDKIGADAPEGMVFKGRIPTGQLYDQVSPEESRRNLVTSRILRLRGLESGKNNGPGCDSFDRYIYIHGTNHEDRIGQPFSGGCVEMLNQDVIRLFDQIETGDHVWIDK